MYEVTRELKMADNGGSRIGIDRRQFNYSIYIPERRSGRDRRKGLDRRVSMAQRKYAERRSIFNSKL